MISFSPVELELLDDELELLELELLEDEFELLELELLELELLELELLELELLEDELELEELGGVSPQSPNSVHEESLPGTVLVYQFAVYSLF